MSAEGAEKRIEEAVASCCRGTFCSELVATAMQAAGLLTHVVPAHVSPSELARQVTALQAGFTAAQATWEVTSARGVKQPAFGMCPQDLNVVGFL